LAMPSKNSLIIRHSPVLFVAGKVPTVRPPYHLSLFGNPGDSARHEQRKQYPTQSDIFQGSLHAARIPSTTLLKAHCRLLCDFSCAVIEFCSSLQYLIYNKLYLILCKCDLLQDNKGERNMNIPFNPRVW